MKQMSTTSDARPRHYSTQTQATAAQSTAFCKAHAVNSLSLNCWIKALQYIVCATTIAATVMLLILHTIICRVVHAKICVAPRMTNHLLTSKICAPL